MDKAISCITQNYANFSGRASRSEFWYFFLLCLIVGFVAGLIGGIIGSPAIVHILQLAILIPSLAVGARRLHDTDKSGWLQLIALIPILGGLALLILCALPGTTGANKYGSDPLAV